MLFTTSYVAGPTFTIIHLAELVEGQFADGAAFHPAFSSGTRGRIRPGNEVSIDRLLLVGECPPGELRISVSGGRPHRFQRELLKLFSAPHLNLAGVEALSQTLEKLAHPAALGTLNSAPADAAVELQDQLVQLAAIIRGLVALPSIGLSLTNPIQIGREDDIWIEGLSLGVRLYLIGLEKRGP